MVTIISGCSAKDDGLIGREGGIVEALGGAFTLEIPEDALHTDTLVLADEADEAPSRAVGPAVSLRPDQLVFAVPGVATLDVSAANVVELSELVLVGLRDDEWVQLPDLEHDAELGTVEGSVMYLTTFAAVSRGCHEGHEDDC